METKNILNEFLQELLNGVRDAGAFVKEQLPLVLQEYVTWGIVQGVLMAIIGGIMMFIAWRMWSRWAWPNIKQDEEDGMGYIMAMVFLGLPLAGGGGLLLCEGVLSGIKALVAPRVYLLEELSKLVS